MNQAISKKIKNNCLATYQGSNNIEFPDILRSSSLETICTPNILIADPLLGPLQDNGGPTLTMALLPGSPAIDAGGNFPLTTATDQRGSARIGKPDIGAFELNLEQDFAINQVVLINADNDTEIKTFSEIELIDLSQLSTQNFSFRADPRITPGSIKFELSGPINHTQVENAALYALFSNNGNDFFGRIFPVGLYQLKVTPYAGRNTSGQAGPSLVFGFRVVNQSSPQQVVALGLINANTDKVIKYLTEGCQVNQDEILENNLSIRVLTLPETVGSVGMQLNGPLNILRTENQSPYALFGDVPRWDYLGQFFPAGAYTFSATPYSKSNLTGIPGLGSNIAFTISGSNDPSFRLELSTDGNGTARVLPNQTSFNSPTNITLVANQSSGYAFSNWTQANGAVISTANPYTFTITTNQQIRANFSPVSNQPTISGAMLINAANSQEVFLLQNGQTLSLNQLALNNGISLRADAPSQTKSVRFIVSNSSGNVLINRVENLRPFSLLGDNQITYVPWFPASGAYILTLIPYSATQASGFTGPSYTLTFSITQSNLPAARTTSSKSASGDASAFQLYPNPTDTGLIYLQTPISHSPLARVEIVDFAGKTLQTILPSSLSKVAASENTWQISLNGFAPGAYILKALHANGEIVTLTFIKQ
ncbi:MAG: T9SS type A sorting domain-containing protein [Microscillaceae bacterium]|nr:T9SS type A sorting domain-containing protein [Microscillaceae bacterium]